MNKLRIIKTGSLLGDDVMVGDRVVGRLSRVSSTFSSESSGGNVWYTKDPVPWKATRSDRTRQAFRTRREALDWLSQE